MRLEPHSNMQRRLLRKKAAGETAAAIPKRAPRAGTAESAHPTEEAPALAAASNRAGRGLGGRTERQGRLQTPVDASGKADDNAATAAGSERARRVQRRSRFMGPAQMDEGCKAEIIRALENHQIGDDMGRQIFVGALEYQLTAFGPQLEHREDRPAEAPPAPAQIPDQALAAIREQSRTLAESLRNLGERAQQGLIRTLTDQDRLDRAYDGRYLCQLGCEIERLEQACAAAASEATAPAIPAEDPTPSRGLVKKLAEIYASCFEEEPTAESGGRFQTLLAVLAEKTGLIIGHDPAFLEEVLRA
jgi:hypothetical protein